MFTVVVASSSSFTSFFIIIIISEPMDGIASVFKGPYYEWWNYVDGEYLGCEKSVRYVSDWVAEHGPIDGIIAFSQGSALTSLMLAMSQSGHNLLPGLQFVVLLSGFFPRNARDLVATTGPLTIPAFSVYGRTDYQRDECMQFADYYSKSHRIPALSTLTTIIRQYHICGACRRTRGSVAEKRSRCARATDRVPRAVPAAPGQAVRVAAGSGW